MIAKRFSILTCLIVILFTLRISGQTYHFSFENNKLEFLTSFGLNLGIHVYDRLRPGEYFDDYEELNISQLWQIDRPAINNVSSQADTWSDVFLYASVLTPVGLYLSNRSHQDKVGNILLMGLHGYFLQDAMNLSFKMMAERPRPYLYNLSEETLLTRLNKNDTKSFYSGHTSTSAYFTFFCAKVLSDLNPDSKLVPVYWAVGGALPAVTGYLRYRAGKHFATDVIIGYLIGAGYGILVPIFYKNKNIDLNVMPGGLSVKVQF